MSWQDILALLAVAAAAAYLTRRAVRRLTGRTAVGCDTCPAREGASGEGRLVQLEVRPPSKSR